MKTWSAALVDYPPPEDSVDVVEFAIHSPILDGAPIVGIQFEADDGTRWVGGFAKIGSESNLWVQVIPKSEWAVVVVWSTAFLVNMWQRSAKQFAWDVVHRSYDTDAETVVILDDRLVAFGVDGSGVRWRSSELLMRGEIEIREDRGYLVGTVGERSSWWSFALRIKDGHCVLGPRRTSKDQV